MTIGGHVYEVRGADSKPIGCEIPAGRHELVMRRGGLVLYEERFEIHGGEGRVLTAGDPERLRRRL